MVIDKEIVLATEGRVTSEFDKVLHLVYVLHILQGSNLLVENGGSCPLLVSVPSTDWTRLFSVFL